MISGRYRSYNRYKDSGEKWIGKVPEHWDVQRLGQYFEERREKVSDKDYQPLSVTMNGIVPQIDTAAKTDDGDNRKLVLKNDFVINSRSDRKGSSGVSNLDGSVSLISIVLKPRDIRPNYVHHLLRSYPFQEEFYRFGKGIVADLWSTNASEMRNIRLPIPSGEEQEQIANFLDHEIAKIDSLIEKQQQLIKLLKEKRQAVISYAVTKGLNPDAPMKDSGVEWLGEVPEHWDVSPVRYITNEVTVGIVVTPAKYYVDEGIPCFRSLNVKENQLSETDFVYISASNNDCLAKSKVYEDDILIVRTGQPGTAAVVTATYDSVNCIDLIILRKNKSFDSNYLCYQINSDICKCQVSSGSGGAIQQHFNVETAKGLFVTVPPKKEQKQIAEHLTQQCVKYEKLIGNSERFITLIRERRTSLISAAVTGKIDVRNWQPNRSQTPMEACA